MSLAYFAFYPNDFIGATCHLNNEQAGAYIKILCFLWQKERSKERYLKAVGFGSVNVGLEDWEAVAELLQIDENGLYYNRRLEEERVKAIKKHAAQVNNGSKGGRPKGSGKKSKAKTNPLDNQNKPMANPQGNPIKTNHNHNHNHIKEIESVGSLEVYDEIKNSTHAQPTANATQPKDAKEVETHANQFFKDKEPTQEKCESFFNHWEGSGWMDSNLKQINWKQKLGYYLSDAEKPKVVISKKELHVPIVTDYFEMPTHTEEEEEAFEKNKEKLKNFDWRKAE